MRLSIFSSVPCPWPLVGSDYVWTLKPVPCWVLNFCDYIKTFSKLFLLMGSGWGLAMLGPRLFIFFQGRTAWFCVKEGFPVKLFIFLHHSHDFEFISLLGVWILILVPCKAHLNRSIFELLAYFKRSLTGSVSLYISTVQGSLRVLFSGLSSLLLRSVTFFPFFIKGQIPFPVVRVEVSGRGSCLCVI